MGFEKIQKDVDDWTGQYTPQYWSPYEMLACLTEETGEVAREINHLYGTKKKKSSEIENNAKNLSEELIDVIYTVVCIANSQGINLDKEWNKMIKEKLYGRDKNRFEKK